MSNTKNKNWSSVEDDKTRGHKTIKKIARSSARKAIKFNKAKDIPVTYLKGNKIIKETNGKEEVLEVLDLKQRKVEVGAKAKYKKK